MPTRLLLILLLALLPGMSMAQQEPIKPTPSEFFAAMHRLDCLPSEDLRSEIIPPDDTVRIGHKYAVIELNRLGMATPQAVAAFKTGIQPGTALFAVVLKAPSTMPYYELASWNRDVSLLIGCFQWTDWNWELVAHDSR